MKICSKCGAEVQANFCAHCGTKYEEVSSQAVPVPLSSSTPQGAVVTTMDSKFEGGAFANFFIGLLSYIVSIISIGLLAPAMICWKQRWIARNTYINGKQLVFDGRGAQLLGRFLLWMLLSVVTLGIFSLWVPVKLEKWKTKHTHFEGTTCTGDENNTSDFDGRVIALIGVNLLTWFVTIITLTFGLYWAICYRKRWWTKHTVIDGQRLAFDGRGIQLFGKMLLWALLTVITIGIYSFWLIVKKKKWLVSHTHIEGAVLLTVAPQAFVPNVPVTLTPVAEKQAEDNANSKGLSITGFIFSFVFPPIGLILSAIAVGKKKGARGLAIAGLIISLVTTLVYAFYYVIMFSGMLPQIMELLYGLFAF